MRKFQRYEVSWKDTDSAFVWLELKCQLIGEVEQSNDELKVMKLWFGQIQDYNN